MNNRGLVIGKFYPPHRGHSYLIDYALAHSDSVDVLVCDSPQYNIPAKQRQAWLQSIHPNATVHIIPDLDDDDNSEAWAEHTIAFLGYTPDTVFSSEDYGIPYATYMRTKHHMVDRERVHVPISATRIRSNLLQEWEFLDPIVRADMAIRIAIVGAESTGTTTLARDLAASLQAPWVPEYGRLYSEAMMTSSHEWTDDDFVHIARTQQRIEQRIASLSNGIVVCDTNATATGVWQQRYMNHTTSEVEAIGSHDKVGYYIITGDEIPFVQDGTRDGEHIRHTMHEEFVRSIEATGVPYAVLRGSREQRLEEAERIVAKITEDSSALVGALSEFQ
jgi:HTH-type transcriptional regulator, transcriptional repressor of NAD biosynthesis genes